MRNIIYFIILAILPISAVVAQELPAEAVSSNIVATIDDSDVANIDYRKGHFLHFGAAGGFGQLNYHLQGGNTAFYMPSFTADIQYSYFFQPWFGITSGFNLSYYTSRANLTQQIQWLDVADTEGESYTHITDFHNWSERQHELAIEIPLALSFKTKSDKGALYFNVGAKLGIPVYAGYIHDRGEIIHSGYYPQWDMTLSCLPERFETEPMLRAVEGSFYDKIKKANASGFAELGAIIPLDATTSLTLGIYANYYINNQSTIKESEAVWLGFRNEQYHTDFMNQYDGLIGTKHIGAIHPWAAGIKIGIQTRLLTKAERELLKASKQAKQHDALPFIQDTIIMYDTIFVHDTLYMTVQETPVGSQIRRDTTWIVRIDTICPDPNNPGQYINITQERIRREDEQMAKEASEKQKDGKQVAPVITEQGKRAAKHLDGKLTTSVIWFRFDDYKPILEPFDVIDTVAQALLADPELHVFINGHACKIGADSYNQRLAMRRAQAVARLLRLKGVPTQQMTVRSLGADEPYQYNGERHQYSKDRRVEIVPAGIELSDNTASQTLTADFNTAPQQQRTDINYGKYTKFIGEEKVKVGSRLAQIARRWYGHWEYWVYIYEANADKIESPSLIHPGLVVMIPDVKTTYQNMSEQQIVQQAREIEKQYITDKNLLR